jgi:GT2 family glycosyltransferase
MGRLYHLKETFFQNIKDNEDYPDLEFVLLDYNSPDGLEMWARSHLKGLIQSGRVVFVKERSAKEYWSSHAKNLAAGMASGEILIGLDADNFTGKGFASRISDIFMEGSSVVWGDINGGLTGRIVLSKYDFHQLRGYNEAFIGWGADDTDLVVRAKKKGIREVVTKRIGREIIHGDDERVRHFSIKDKNVSNAINIAMRQKITRINPEGYGRAVVYRNFEEIPLKVGWGVDS